MVTFFDRPDHFYYADLLSALQAFEFSKEGIHQILTLLPVIDRKDREILRVMLVKLFARIDTPYGVTDLTEDHTSSHLWSLGLSQAATFQLLNKMEPVNDPKDRLALLSILAAGYVRNETFVPRGLTGPHRMLWKQNQMKKKS